MPNYKVTAAGGLNIRSGPGADYEDVGDLAYGQVVTSPDTTGWLPILVTNEDDTGLESVAWASKKYLAKDTTPEPADPVVPATEPVWIQWARKQIGQKEVPGIASNPVIQAWYHLTTLPEYLWTDSTAWCAVFVNAALMLNNIKTNRSARAFDWLTYGTGVDVPRKGDLVIFDFSHIAFYLEDASATKINCLGGNQSDMVNITAYNKATVREYRRVNA